MSETSDFNSAMETDKPLLIEIEPAYGCNLRCIMCHVPTHANTKPTYLDIDALAKATEGITNCHIMLGSEYEPTIHPEIEKLFRLIVMRNWKVDFLSNGVNLHKLDQGLLTDVPFHVFNASFDGASKDTFERIRIGANYGQVKENIIRTAGYARNHGGKTAINATMMKSNIHETSDLIEMWNHEDFDLVRLHVMQARDISEVIINESLYGSRHELFNTLDEAAHLISRKKLRIGVRNGYYASERFNPPEGIHVHQATIFSEGTNYQYVPGVRQEFQYGTWPSTSFPCRSPFVYCRVRWDGSIDLCNRREWVVGNIYDDSLLDIWHGHEAHMMRQEIIADVDRCNKCDYFRLCIKQKSNQDYEKKEYHFSTGMLSLKEIDEYIIGKDAENHMP